MTEASAVAPAKEPFLPCALIQTGHRVASIAVLTFVAALVAILAANGALGPNVALPPSAYSTLLMITFLAADLAVLLAFVAWWMDRRPANRFKEIRGLLIFSLVLLTTSMALFVMGRNQSLDRFVQSHITPKMAPEQ